MYGIAEYVGNSGEQVVKATDLYGKEIPFTDSPFSVIPAVEVSGVGIAKSFYECLLVLCSDTYVYVVGHQTVCEKDGITFICRDEQTDYSVDVIFS